MKKELKKENKKRLIYLDILKIIACFFVIINHSSLALFNYTGFTKTSVLFYSTTFSICKMAVPIFIMVTGALILNKEEYTIENSLKSVIRILLPLLAISLYLYIKDNPLSPKIIIKFIEDPLMTLYWYLYMLIGLYLIYPILNKMVKNLKHQDLRYLIILCLIIPGTIYLLSRIFNINISGYFMLSFFSFPVMYSIAGKYLTMVEINKRNRNIAFICLITALILFTGFMYYSYIKNGEISYILDNNTLIVTILPSMSIFYLIRYYFHNKNNNEKINKVISKISNTTFGIYLFHPFLLYGIELNISKIFSLNAYLGIILNQILCFIACGLVTYILQKIPIVKKFL